MNHGLPGKSFLKHVLSFPFLSGLMRPVKVQPNGFSTLQGPVLSTHAVLSRDPLSATAPHQDTHQFTLYCEAVRSRVNDESERLKVPNVPTAGVAAAI